MNTNKLNHRSSNNSELPETNPDVPLYPNQN